jgi:hypothetical protein
MQAESGQDIQGIIARKELERQAGDGLFFWGIGSAPSRSIKTFAARNEDIDVVFSLMKSRPNVRDVAPANTLVWQTYFDLDDVERPLPPHVLVTSRMEIGSGTKRVHYALMCWTDKELRFGDHGAFDPSAYRNIGDAGGPVGSSQVTALIIRTRPESPVSDYRINFRAKLTGTYWVKLGRPCLIAAEARADITSASARATEMDRREWNRLVSEIRSIGPFSIEAQPGLF